MPRNKGFRTSKPKNQFNTQYSPCRALLRQGIKVQEPTSRRINSTFNTRRVEYYCVRDFFFYNQQAEIINSAFLGVAHRSAERAVSCSGAAAKKKRHGLAVHTHARQVKPSQELISGIHGAGAKQGPWGQSTERAGCGLHAMPQQKKLRGLSVRGA